MTKHEKNQFNRMLATLQRIGYSEKAAEIKTRTQNGSHFRKELISAYNDIREQARSAITNLESIK